MHAHAHAPDPGAQKKSQLIFWGVACLEGKRGCQLVGDTWLRERSLASEVCLKKSRKSWGMIQS